MKKFFLITIIFLISISGVVATPFNIPVDWVLNDEGESIDSNLNGWPDYADNVLNSTYSILSNNTLLFDNKEPSYYLNYSNFAYGYVSDMFISSSSYWNNKATTGGCSIGEYVTNITSSSIECSPFETDLVNLSNYYNKTETEDNFVSKNGDFINGSVNISNNTTTKNINITGNSYLSSLIICDTNNGTLMTRNITYAIERGCDI